MSGSFVKYLQIEKDIRNDILLKNLRPDDRIMTEEQLCEKYGVSRMTVNKAISNLVNGGYIYRVPGRGSFVCRFHVTKHATKGQSFTDDMLSLGLQPGSKLIDYRVIKGENVPDVASKLNLSASDFIHYFTRLRTGNDLPIAISYTYVSGKCVPVIDVNWLEKSFYEYVKSIGLRISHMEGEMTAVLPTEEQKGYLGVRDEALLLSAHKTCLVDGRVMEYIRTYYAGSRYSYSFVARMPDAGGEPLST
ncbi:MAG: GntR family transcriptional regulator [Synergistaceae bacterium]|jgi:DNA-binding GntR family transcriptional regulator|nr:GntR family transcriptional regulator [Synergistaceae bacterium]